MNISAIASESKFLIDILHWFMVILFVGWGGFMVYCLVRFRAKEGGRAIYQPIKAKISKYVEVLIVLFEAFLLIGLSIPAWSSFKNDFPKDAEAYHVRVVAQQYMWNFHYAGLDGIFGTTNPDLVVDAQNENPVGLDPDDPASLDDIVTQNNLYIPRGKKIIAYLSSKDVIHSFGIHRISVKQDIIPGSNIKIWFESNVDSGQFRTSLTKAYQVNERSLLPGAERFSYVAMETIGGVAKGTVITPDVLETLRYSGIQYIDAAPQFPVELACSQLCGLGHYRMRAFTHILGSNDLKAWQLEALRDRVIVDWEQEDITGYFQKWNKKETMAFMALWQQADIDYVFEEWTPSDLRQVFRGWSSSELNKTFGRG